MKNLVSVPLRYEMVFLLLAGWILIYLQRVNISILLIDKQFLTDVGLLGKPAGQGLLMTAFLLAYSFSNITGSMITDRIGPRKTMFLGLVLSALAVAAAGFVQSLMLLLATRVLVGMGHGLYFPSQSVLIRNWFPPEERGKANSLYAVGGCLAPVLAIPLFTAVLDWGSWSWTFWLAALLGSLMLFPLGCGKITDTPEQHANGRNLSQRVRTESDELPLTGPRERHPYRKLLMYPEFWLICAAYIAVLSVWWGLLTWLPQYLMVARDLSVKDLNWAASLPYVLAGLGVLGGGFFSDRLNRRAVYGVIALSGAAGCILVGSFTSSVMISVLLLTLGSGFNQLFYAPVWSMLQSLLPANLVATGSGVMNGISNLVSGLAPYLIGFLIQLTGAYESGLVYLAGVAILGAFSSFILTRKSL